MKIKEIYVEAKKSKNFQTYTAGITAEIEEDETPTECIAKLQAKCRKVVLEQIALDIRK